MSGLLDIKKRAVGLFQVPLGKRGRAKSPLIPFGGYRASGHPSPTPEPEEMGMPLLDIATPTVGSLKKDNHTRDTSAPLS